MHRPLPSPACVIAEALPSPDTAKAAKILAAANLILPSLARGQAVSTTSLRAIMTAAFGASDADGAWRWHDADEACEVAQVVFLRRYGPAMRRQAPDPAAILVMLQRVAALLPTQTKRSEDSQRFQQFSTSLDLGFVASVAAAITADDLVLEPSAGTGLLAIHVAQTAAVVLNELAPDRADLLDRLFPSHTVTRHDAAQIDDRLAPDIRPTVVLMNPPFSVAAHVEGRVRDAAFQHLRSAFARLAEGGRLVAITGASLDSHARSWREAFVSLQERGRVIFSAVIDGRAYVRHGTTIDTRLTVIDKVPASDAGVFTASPGHAPDARTLLAWLTARLPARSTVIAPPMRGASTSSIRPTSIAVRRPSPLPARSPIVDQVSVEVGYEAIDWMPEERGSLSDAIYEGYSLQALRMPDAKAHPTLLVQSAAMASVAPPKPTYRPRLPPSVVTAGLLSDAQLESVIYAGEAHAGHLDGSWSVDVTFDVVAAAPDDAEGAVRFRRGWFLGDGTGAGKGRQVVLIGVE